MCLHLSFNTNLILTYKTIKTNPIQLIQELDKLKKEYNEIKLLKDDGLRKPKSKVIEKSKVFYWIRQKYNNFNSKTNKVKIAAYFIFLNKTCFRGLHQWVLVDSMFHLEIIKNQPLLKKTIFYNYINYLKMFILLQWIFKTL